MQEDENRRNTRSMSRAMYSNNNTNNDNNVTSSINNMTLVNGNHQHLDPQPQPQHHKHQHHNRKRKKTADSEPKKNTDIFSEREGDGGVKVGRDFQAKIPPILKRGKKHLRDDIEQDILVWCPSEKLTDAEIEHYLTLAKEKYLFSGEQALGLLYCHEYDVEESLSDLGNFTLQPEEWTAEDKVLFDLAFQFHGKDFNLINEMMPTKSMASLVKYYYKSKRLKNKSSVMDRQAKKSQEDDLESICSTSNSSAILNTSNMSGDEDDVLYRRGLVHRRRSSWTNESDSEDEFFGESGENCGNCGVLCTVTYLHSSSEDELCKTCYIHLKHYGENRLYKIGPLRIVLHKKCPRPHGMYINHDDLLLLANSETQSENVILTDIDKDVVNMKSQIRENRIDIDLIKRNYPTGGVSKFKPKEGSNVRSTRNTDNTNITKLSQDKLYVYLNSK